MVAKCHLEYDGFDSFLTKALRKIFEAHSFADITLVGDDNIPIEAHRLILSAHSSVLENAIIESKTAKPTLQCKGFTYQDLHAMLTYLYLGEVSVPFAQAGELLMMAKYLKISQLGEECKVTDNNLNRMFAVVPMDEHLSNSGPEVKAEVLSLRDVDINEPIATAQEVDDQDIGTFQFVKNLGLNENIDFDEDDVMGTYQSAYESFEDAVDEGSSEVVDYDPTCVEDNEESLKADGTAEGKKKQKKNKENSKKRVKSHPKVKRQATFDEEGFDPEELKDGPEMVGKPLPDYPIFRSVAFSHYYFVKMKPVNGVTWARCNLCWFKIGSGSFHLFGRNQKFIKISGFKRGGITTTPMITHLNNRHPDIMEQFLRQHVEANKEQLKFKENEKNKKLKKVEERNRRKEELKEKRKVERKELKRVKMELKHENNSFDKIKKLSEKYPEYDFVNLDEDILAIAVGEPKLNHNPFEAVVYSHNYFRRLFPKNADESLKAPSSTSFSECIMCAQRNERSILKTTGGSTSGTIHHIQSKHPDLFSKFQKQSEIKSRAKKHHKQLKQINRRLISSVKNEIFGAKQ